MTVYRNPAELGTTKVVQVAPTVTAGAYTAEDTFGGEMEIPEAADKPGGGGIVMSVVMTAEDDGSADFAASDIDVLFFRGNPAGTYTDNTAISSALTDADAALLLGVVTLNTKVDLGNITLLQATNVNLPYVCDGQTLYAVAVKRATNSPDATDAVQFTFGMIRG